MNFDISKLGAGQSKAGGGKAKPRFGPAVRTIRRAKPAAKPAEAPATDEPAVEPQAGVTTNTVQQGHVNSTLPGLAAPVEPASDSAAVSGVPESQPDVEPLDALPTQPEKQVRRPAAGKRKAAEAAQAVPEGVPAHDLPNDGPAGMLLELTATDNSPETANTGPMTKAKKRKGMGSGSAAVPRKPKTPLAELKIDAQTMNMKTVIKCANAKDRAKSNAAQLAKEAAAIGQGSSGRQQAPPPPTPEPVSTGAPQMIVDPETGNLVLDKASLTVQAQPREEYVRREEGHHDLVNSQTYLKRGATNKWTPEETDEFWAGLAIFGDMPGMIATRLNLRLAQLGSFNITRTSKHVKNKIKKERSKNPRQVDAVIANQHAEPEDYAEVQEGLEPTQVDEDEYLEAAPDAEDGQEPAAAGMGRQIKHVSDTTTAVAEAQPALPVSAAQAQPQARHLAAKGPSSARARPRVSARPRAGKSAQQTSLKADVQQQQQQVQVQQQKAVDNSETRYLRMLQESGVTPEEMEEAY